MISTLRSTTVPAALVILLWACVGPLVSQPAHPSPQARPSLRAGQTILSLGGTQSAPPSTAPSSAPRDGGSAGSLGPAALVQFREWAERNVRPRLAGEGLTRTLLGLAGILSLGFLATLTIWLDRRRISSIMYVGEQRLSKELEQAKVQHSASAKALADQVREGRAAQSTLFVRITNMLQARNKKEFFNIFGEAVLKGFFVRQCAFYLYDRTSGTLAPMVFEMGREPGAGDSMASGIVSRIREVQSPAIRAIRVVPGEGTLIGWCAQKAINNPGQGGNKTIGAAAEQFKTDRTQGDINSDRPLKTSYCISVHSRDPITLAEKFVGIVSLGDPQDNKRIEDPKLVMNLLQAVSTITGLAFAKADLFELQAAELASTKELTMKEMEQRKQMRSVLDRVVAPQLADELLANPEALNSSGQMVDATVFFSDIRGFTTYSEKRTPAEVVAILNEYLSAMTDVILEYQGTLDKFVGDQIMAFWGALPKVPNHAELAVKAALKMRAVLASLQVKWRAEGREPLQMGMGLSSGPMLFGCIGSSKKVDFTVMGDTVNLGARLESLTRQYQNDLIISARTHELVKHVVEADRLGEVTVKGKTEAVPIFGVKHLKN